MSYSAVKTIFDRLERKRAIRRDSQVGRTIVYTAMVAEDRVRARLLRDYVAKSFPGGDRKPLFNALIRDGDLSTDEVEYLQKLLNKQSR
jgi:predicted transcriptional regulator